MPRGDEGLGYYDRGTDRGPFRGIEYRDPVSFPDSNLPGVVCMEQNDYGGNVNEGTGEYHQMTFRQGDVIRVCSVSIFLMSGNGREVHGQPDTGYLR